jgi:hypothetical protein
MHVDGFVTLIRTYVEAILLDYTSDLLALFHYTILYPHDFYTNSDIFYP